MAPRYDSNEYNEQQWLNERVDSRFNVRDRFLREEGSVEVEVEESSNTKKEFVGLLNDVKKRGYLAFLRKRNGLLILTIVRSASSEPRNPLIPLILFIATIGTVIADGFIRSVSFPGYNMLTIVGLYTIGVIGIIGIHELGHKLAASTHGMVSSMPYFIPGIPGVLPTLGAVISSREPPANRDSLFDLGISGPISGLVITIVVAIGGALTTASVPLDQLNSQVGSGQMQPVPSLDTLTSFLLGNFASNDPNSGLILSPLIFASSLGFLITFINLMPAWQLDGGHVARAMLSTKKHRILTIISVIILALIGFWLMAILILMLSSRNPEMRPLDDVSPLSLRRKIFFALTWLIAALIYIFAIQNNPFFTLNF